jgi:hypothetical protein
VVWILFEFILAVPVLEAWSLVKQYKEVVESFRCGVQWEVLRLLKCAFEKGDLVRSCERAVIKQ